jgi:SGNH hydrolase-like domain, acetyltransferase AlgX
MLTSMKQPCLLIARLLLFVHGTATANDLPAFRAACGVLATEARAATPPRFAIPGQNGWFYSAPELAHLAGGDFWGEALSAKPEPRHEDPLPGILAFHEQLKARGVTLVPVPTKAAVHPEGLPASIPAAAAADPSLPAFLKALSDQGVQVIDLAAAFAKPTKPLYCRSDTHWNPEGIRVAAAKVSDIVRAQPWYNDAAKVELSSTPVEIPILGDLYKTFPNFDLGGSEKLTVDRVGNFKTSAESPLVLLGDSHLQFLSAGGDMFATQSGFAEQVTLQTGLLPDVISRSGSAGMVRRDVLIKSKNPAWLAGKKMVVWAFTCRELSQAEPGSWRTLNFPPVTR